MRSRLCALAGLYGLLFFAGAVQAETKVSLTKMHLCCGACYKAVSAAVEGVSGATVAFDRQAKSATISATDDKTAQKAVDAIAKAGFHGASDHDKVKMHADSGAKKGKVTRLELTGIHNCCGACNRALVKTFDSVAGIEANTSKPRAKTVVVEGNFDALELVSALYKAGFHVKVKQ